MIIINSKDEFLINQKIHELKQQHSEKTWIEHVFNNSLVDLINDLNQLDLFSNDNKIYLIKDATFLTVLKDFENNFDLLQLILKSSGENNNTLFIFITNSKLLTNKKIIPFIEKCKLVLLEEINPKNKTSIIKSICKELKLRIDTIILNKLSESLPLDYGIIYQELSKLMNYDEINLDLIDKIIIKYDEANIFKLWECFLKGDLNQLLSLLKTLYDNKYDPIQIIAIISTQILNSYFIRKSLDLNLTKEEMISNFQINPYILSNQIILLKNWQVSDLKCIIIKLYETEVQIKESNLDKFELLKIFFLKSFVQGDLNDR